MKRFLLALVILPIGALAQSLPSDISLLRKQCDLDCKAAIKPIVTKYAGQLDALHKLALQEGDAKKAVAIESEASELKARTGVDVPLSTLPGAVHFGDSSIPTVVGTVWKRDGSTLRLNENGVVISPWGAKGRWTNEPGKNLLLIKWTTRWEHWRIDEGGKVIHQETGEPWMKAEQ